MSDQMTSAGFHRAERAGSPSLVLVFAALLVAAAVAFSLLPRDEASNLIVGLLALLAVVGIFALFGYAVGILQFGSRSGRNDVTRSACDSGPEGMLITDAGGKFLYANESYMRFAQARGAADLRGIERLFSGFARRVRGGLSAGPCLPRGQARHRGAAACARRWTGTAGGVGWYRVRVRPLRLAGRHAQRYGPSPTSRESASATRTSSRSCSTRSTSSIMRPPASSHASAIRRMCPT